MTIEWRPDDRQFHLHNDRVSMILRVYEDGSLGGLHLGAPLAPGRSYRHLGPDPFEGFGNRVGDPIPFVYPTSGTGDLRVPALVASGPDGSGTVVLRYAGHEIAQGKPSIAPLPSTYVESDEEADTLTVELVDDRTGLTVDLRFTLFADRPIVARSATLRATRDAIILRTAMSLSLDLPDHDWVARLVERRLGAGGTRHRGGPPTWPRRAVEPARGIRRRAQPVPGPPTGVHGRGCRRGDRLQPRVLRQLPGRG